MQHQRHDDIPKAAVRLIEDIGRIRLSPSFFFRDFLYSEIATVTGLPNIPTNVDAAVWAGRRLCMELLEPMQCMFGPIRIRSGYRSELVNRYGNHHRLGCASNASNYGCHIWDQPDSRGARGAMACIVVPSLTDHYERTGDWQSFAWFIHEHLPYSEMTFFPKLAAFNIGWSEQPRKSIDSFATPRGVLMRSTGQRREGQPSNYRTVPLLRAAAARAKTFGKR